MPLVFVGRLGWKRLGMRMFGDSLTGKWLSQLGRKERPVISAGHSDWRHSVAGDLVPEAKRSILSPYFQERTTASLDQPGAFDEVEVGKRGQQLGGKERLGISATHVEAQRCF